MESISNGFRKKSHRVSYAGIIQIRLYIPRGLRDRCRVYSQIRIVRNTPNDFQFKEQILEIIYRNA